MKLNGRVCVVLLFALSIKANAHSDMSLAKPSPLKTIESLAKYADVEHPDSINSLTHAVLTSPHALTLPFPLSKALEFDLARSETTYRNGMGPGVSEDQILTLMNSLTKKLNLPSYALTSQAQLRLLRMNLVRQSPVFMGSGLNKEGMKIGDSMPSVMSPLQAMHLFQVMVDQKILNPDYQDPTIDPFVRDTERREELTKHASAPAFLQIRQANPKRIEMTNTIASATETFTIADCLDIVNQAMTSMQLK